MLDKDPAHRILDPQIAEGIATREVEEGWDRPQNFALCALARAGRPKAESFGISSLLNRLGMRFL
jgi:hypothetical protein